MTRRLWVPEVIQAADTDCGPASLASLLAGFGLHVPYERLREACETDVDGTSVDDLEDVARACGLDAEQAMVPVEHLATAGDDLLPAIVVLALPGGYAHFVVVWRRVGAWFQVMDPMVGRRWMSRRHLLDGVYRHRTSVPAEVWREWAGSEANLAPLRARLRQLGLPRRAAAALVDEAVADPGWRTLGVLDALVRAAELGAARGHRREAAARLAGLAGGLAARVDAVPERFFSAWSAEEGGDLALTGAIVVVAAGVAEDASAAEQPLATGRVGVLRLLAPYLRADGIGWLVAFGLAAALAGGLAALEALLFQGVLGAGAVLPAARQHAAGVGFVAVFVAGVLLLELPLAAGVRTLGRRLEARLRADLARQLVHLPDRWFAQRPTSDLTLRIHSVVQLRGVPALGEGLLRTGTGLAATAAGIAWIDPACAPLALGAVAVTVGLPLILQPRLAELQLAAATYQGGLSRYLLDALLAALPLRTHVGQAALQGEHDRLLVRWARLRADLVRASVALDAAMHGAGMIVSWLVLRVHLRDPASILLLGFWASQLPTLGRGLARGLFELPARRAVVARVSEAIQASVEPTGAGTLSADGGARVAFRGVGLAVGRAVILDAVDLELEPGCHCAVVGASGSGKSSLLGLLLGWHTPTAGAIEVDGRPIAALDRDALSAQIAWIDPQVQLWNRSLYANLTYGAPTDAALAEAIDAAGLRSVVARLPSGLASPLGDGGRALSQGEGQRVRVARALLRRDARLVLLDEPFRGLDRETRRRMLGQLRRWWPRATVLCATHDVQEAMGFDRVVVLEGGRAVEQGAPGVLARRAGSSFARRLAAEREVRGFLDRAPGWRRWEVRHGSVQDEPGASEPRRLCP